MARSLIAGEIDQNDQMGNYTTFRTSLDELCPKRIINIPLTPPARGLRHQRTISIYDSKFESLNSRFDNLKDFLIEHFVTKQEFEARFSELPTKQDFQNLVSTVNGYAKQVNDTNQEILILGKKKFRSPKPRNGHELARSILGPQIGRYRSRDDHNRRRLLNPDIVDLLYEISDALAGICSVVNKSDAIDDCRQQVTKAKPVIAEVFDRRSKSVPVARRLFFTVSRVNCKSKSIIHNFRRYSDFLTESTKSYL